MFQWSSHKLFTLLALYSTMVTAQSSPQAFSSGADRTDSAPSANDQLQPMQPDASCSNTSAFAERYPRAALHAGDTFELMFTYSPELNQTLTIQSDGYVTLSGVGDMHIDGMTTPEIVQHMRKAYQQILRDPEVVVVPKDIQKPYFIFSGEVRKPGKYELRAKTTLTQAVALAGGFTDASKHSEVYVYRWQCGQAVSIAKVNVKKMLKTADLREDIELQPGDMVFVGQNVLSKIKSFVRPSVGATARLSY